MSLPSSVLSPSGEILGFWKPNVNLPNKGFHMPKMEPLSRCRVLPCTKVQTQKDGKLGGRGVVAWAAYNQAQSPPSHVNNTPEYNPQYNVDNHFEPPIWKASDFKSSSSTDMNAHRASEERLIELKKELKNMLSLAANYPFEALELIDKIQQLGVGYHFEAEIESILQQTYNDQTLHREHCAGLYHDSLRFRLLRQAGFYMSPVIFNKYKDDNGEFQEFLASDVQGMLSLYEATYLSIQGEEILDDAQVFTAKHLNSMVTHLPPPLALQVQRALNVPLHNGVERVNARHYISIYQEDESRNEALLEFAKLDFNTVQLLYKKELIELLEWWEPIMFDVKSKMPFQFRDRLVEAYALSVGINDKPDFSLGRIHITKLWALLTVFDDAHDVYCNIEELRPLRDALQRWDPENIDELTEPMKIYFREMMNLMKEIEVDMIRKRHFIGMTHFKKQFLMYAASIFEEATMLHLRDPPKLETWLALSTLTIGYNFTLVVGVMNLGGIAREEVYNWIDNDPDGVVKTYCLLSRLVDDIGTYEVEKKRGQTVSNMFCYMKEYGVSEQEAVRGLQKMMKGLWKELNEKFLRPTPVPAPVLKLILGPIRVIIEFTNYGDGYTEVGGRTKEHIASLLRDPIPI